MKGLIVYAPAGSGIEERAGEIADYKGLSHIIIDSGSERIVANPPINTLVITNLTGIKGALDFSEVLHRMDCHSLGLQKRIAYENRNALLFPHVKYTVTDLAHFVALPVWLRCIRKAYVRLFGWLSPGLRDRLGIR